MESKNYFDMYMKYKKKYLALKTMQKSGSTIEASGEQKNAKTNSINTLSEPFDAGIFEDLNSKFNPDSKIIRNFNKFKQSCKNHGLDLGNPSFEKYQNYIKNVGSEYSELRTLLIAIVKYFTDQLNSQFEANKLSDHAIISFEANGKKIVSFNILDDSFGILIMSVERMENFNLKSLYTTGLTIAIDSLREKRMNKITELLTFTDPDIICLQEVNLKILEKLKNKLNMKGFNRYSINKTKDTYKRKINNKFQTFERDQYRVIFHKEAKVDFVNNIHQFVSGEIMLEGKSLTFIVYNNSLIISAHFSWRLALNDKRKEVTNVKIIGNFLTSCIEVVKKLSVFNINNIIIVGDTNNIKDSLEDIIGKAKSNHSLNITFRVYDSPVPTFFRDLNGGQSIDNLISITINK